MSYYESVILHYFDKNNDGKLNRAELIELEKSQKIFDLSSEEYAKLPHTLRAIAEEVFSAKIIEDNRLGDLESHEKVKHIPIENRPFVL